jgi:hypothetical protein
MFPLDPVDSSSEGKEIPGSLGYSLGISFLQGFTQQFPLEFALPHISHRETLMKALLFFLLISFSLQANAQEEGQVYPMGRLSFDFDQLFGNFDGEYFAEGEIDTSNGLPLIDEGVGGFLTASDSSGGQTLFTMAGTLDEEADSTWNVFGLFHSSPTPLIEGSVADPLSSVYCFFLWHVDSFAMPEVLPDSLSGEEMIQELLGAIVADHKLVGAATSMVIENLDEDGLEYEFAATLLEMDNYTFIVNISDGTGEFETIDIVDVPEAPYMPDAFALHCAPNPFNPSTRVGFNLKQPGHTTMKVFDALGRQVWQDNMGVLGVGPHEWTWHATDRATGVYTIVVEQEGRMLGRDRVSLIK